MRKRITSRMHHVSVTKRQTTTTFLFSKVQAPALMKTLRTPSIYISVVTSISLLSQSLFSERLASLTRKLLSALPYLQNLYKPRTKAH